MELGWAPPVHGKKTCAMQYAWQQNVPFFFGYAECATAAGRRLSMWEALQGTVAPFFHPTEAEALESACRGCGQKLSVGRC